MYLSETDKIKNAVSKYLTGKIIDIGSGGYKVNETAIAVDGRGVENVDFVLNDENMIYSLSYFKELCNADCVFSSHTLEHLKDDYSALLDWSKLLNTGGHLILYLPDGRMYSNVDNLEHCRDYTYDQFMLFFTRCFCGMGKNYRGENFKQIFELVESGEDFKHDCYSFYLVAKKI